MELQVVDAIDEAPVHSMQGQVNLVMQDWYTGTSSLSGNQIIKIIKIQKFVTVNLEKFQIFGLFVVLLWSFSVFHGFLKAKGHRSDPRGPEKWQIVRDQVLLRQGAFEGRQNGE